MYKIYAYNITKKNWLALLEIVKGNQKDVMPKVMDIKKNGHIYLNALPPEDIANIRLIIDNGRNKKKCGGLK